VANRYDGKVAVISGGASGMGRATARRIVAEGGRVLAADVDSSAGAGLTSELGESGAFRHLDVRDPDEWRETVAEAVDRWGSLHMLVNCAGILRTGPIEGLSLEDWRLTLDINLDGTFYGCIAAIPAIRDAGGGAIVNLASVSAVNASPNLPAYDASKGGVQALTVELAAQCAQRGYGIRCNSLLPGTIDTPMVERFFEDPQNMPERPDWFEDVPIGRAGTPEDVAALIAFLGSADAARITGAGFRIDGGMTA
jgi:3alpha(or 20beta)-hydroxysteroid dehydrogenase